MKDLIAKYIRTPLMLKVLGLRRPLRGTEIAFGIRFMQHLNSRLVICSKFPHWSMGKSKVIIPLKLYREGTVGVYLKSLL